MLIITFDAVRRNMNLVIRITGIVILATLTALFSAAASWDPISPEDMAATECPTDPDAEAEFLYKEQIYDQAEAEDRHQRYHFRIKVYRESAVEQFRSHRFRYPSYYRIQGLKARVVKPNGEEFELEKKDIFSKAERGRDNEWETVTSFSIPHLSVGDIVEYRYRLNLDSGYYTPSFFITFQEEWPIRELDLAIRPYNPTGQGYKWVSRRCEAQLKKFRDGFFKVKMENLAGHPDEPYQFPELDSKAWVYFFNVEGYRTGEAYWREESKVLFRTTDKQAKVTRVIKAKVSDLLKGKQSREDKLLALYDYCRLELINSSFRRPGELSKDQRRKLDDDTKAEEVLGRGYGNPGDITKLFAAMARAAGFDARLAVTPSRSYMSFSESLEHREKVLPHDLVAVQNGETWEFYDPGLKYLGALDLNWRNEGVMALVGDKKKAVMVPTPRSDSNFSKSVNRGDFELAEDGTLSGTVTMDFTGNFNFELKSRLDNRSEAEQLEYLEKRFSKGWPNATMSEVEVLNLNNASLPVRISYWIVAPNYAEVVGKRIFVQPNAIERYSEPWFVSEKRVTNLFFRHAFEKEDIVDIKLPDGFELEEASAPKPFEVKPLINYQPVLSLKRKTNQLHYECKTEFTGGSYPAEAYRLIKAAMDEVHRWDQHSITIKKSADADDSAANELELKTTQRLAGVRTLSDV